MVYATLVGGLLATCVGCAHGPLPPPITAHSSRPVGDPSAARVLALEPRFLEVEASDSIPALVGLADELGVRSDANEPWGLYLRARALLRLAVVARFERDHGIATSANDEEQATAWIASGIAVIERALTMEDNVSEFHRVRGELYALRIRSVGAGLRHGSTVTSALDRARVLDPENPYVHLALGKRYLFAPRLLGRNDDTALAFFEHARDLAPSLGEAWFYLAACHEQRSQLEAALSCVERCLELQPGRRMAEILRDSLSGR